MSQRPNNRLKQQTCIVTGANSGIGREVAVAMAKDGANVVINWVANEEATHDILNEVSAIDACERVIAIRADVSKEAEVEAMFEETIDTFGTVDILVNNAGIQRDAAFHEMSLDYWRKVIDVNLTGMFLCSRAAIREFLRRGPRPEVTEALGKIICMSSVHEVIPWAGHANYAASKGGVNMLMQSLAQEYGREKIRINSIAPGAIQTPINRDAWETPEALNKLLTLIPYNRIGRPSDIGSTAVWLASDESDYISGTTIFVDGAMTCYPGFTENG